MTDAPTPGLQWYCLQIYPQFCQQAQEHLARQRFNSFFGERLKRYPRINYEEREPLFKGYGFVQFDATGDPWTAIRSTRGVIRLLPQHTLYPQPMPAGFVERLITENPIVDEALLRLFQDFLPGQEVDIVSGMLQGRKGIVQKTRGNSLVELLIYNLASTPTVLLNRNDLRLATAKEF